MADKNNKLSELYYDIENGFGSAKQLYDDARKASCNNIKRSEGMVKRTDIKTA